jgi:alkanesulfonate monooxygenase SsuD/methylene tetrahydromethanopterin reductase-like flavin-dependent oxidoreductase (luciferase family)
MVAKMVETLDRLSGGRLILGLGGGASDDELRQFGLTVPTPGQKVAGLGEAVEVIRGLWSRPSFSFEGTRYSTANADLEPEPERPIPIWFGTYGPRALELTGRVADGWIPSLGYASAEELPHMRQKVLDAAERAGRDPSTITTALNLDLGDGLDHVPGLIGHGFTTLNFTVPAGPDRNDRIEHLAKEVLPSLRG